MLSLIQPILKGYKREVVFSFWAESVPAFTELGIARGNMSVCSLYRQKDINTVECYTRGFFDLSSGTHGHAILTLQTIATQWLSFSRNMECAQMKKLAWRLRKNSEDSDIIQLAVRPKQKPAESICHVCSKSFSFLPSRKKTCKSCYHVVCSRCCVKKLMCVVAPDQCSILEKKRAFCSRCIHEIMQSDAVAIAREELVTMRHESDPVEYSL